MKIKIKRLSINGISKIDGDNCVIDIPDEELVRLGKKYFELVSKDEKKDTTDEITACARKLKTFCQDHGYCRGCPFLMGEATGGIYGCKIGCQINNKFYTPDNWEV
jgi:hypothetical protein